MTKTEEMIEELIGKIKCSTGLTSNDLREALTEISLSAKKDALQEIEEEMKKFQQGFGYKKTTH